MPIQFSVTGTIYAKWQFSNTIFYPCTKCNVACFTKQQILPSFYLNTFITNTNSRQKALNRGVVGIIYKNSLCKITLIIDAFSPSIMYPINNNNNNYNYNHS